MNNYSYASMRDTFDMSAYFVVGPQDCKSRTITGVLRGGATFIQLRAKNTDAKDITSMARDIAQVIENNGKSDSVAFVIDDRVDVVWQARHKGIKVDGVHIGQTDLEPQEDQRAACRLHRLHRGRPVARVHHQAGSFRWWQRWFRAYARRGADQCDLRCE